MLDLLKPIFEISDRAIAIATLLKSNGLPWEPTVGDRYIIGGQELIPRFVNPQDLEEKEGVKTVFKELLEENKLVWLPYFEECKYYLKEILGYNLLYWREGIFVDTPVGRGFEKIDRQFGAMPVEMTWVRGDEVEDPTGDVVYYQIQISPEQYQIKDPLEAIYLVLFKALVHEFELEEKKKENMDLEKKGGLLYGN